MLPPLLAETMQVAPAKHILCNVSRGQHVYVVCAPSMTMELYPNLKEIINVTLKGVDVFICVVSFLSHNQGRSIVLPDCKFIKLLLAYSRYC